MEYDTVAGPSSDAKSTARHCSCANKVWNTFQAHVYLSKHKLSSKELYLSGETDDYVNHGLAQMFVRFDVQTQG